MISCSGLPAANRVATTGLLPPADKAFHQGKEVSTTMQKITFSAIYHGLVTLALIATGLALLLLGPLWSHPLFDPERAMELALARMAGAGFLLAGAVNAFCLARNETGGILYLLVSAFLLIAVGGHALVVTDHGWFWALPVLHLLPPVLSRLPGLPGLPVAGRHTGEVKWFNPRKGFGFITGDDGTEVFVHFRALRTGHRQSLKPGARVRYRVRTTDRGDQAQDVEIIE